jgi:hypothetical protein
MNQEKNMIMNYQEIFKQVLYVGIQVVQYWL